MSMFSDFFDRVTVISLKKRSDRRKRLLQNLTDCKLSQKHEIVWQEAVDGRKASIPHWWKQGPGAWGCRASHLEALRAARKAKAKQLLIIEDDAYFHHRTGEWIAALIPALPDDWDMFYLGGQHMAVPTSTADARLLLATGVTRTHAYAIHSRAFDKLIKALSNDKEYRDNPSWHVDHQLARGQQSGRWRAYAPAWWMAAQEEGVSNIAVQSFTRRWWQQGDFYWQLPFVHYNETDEVADSCIYQASPTEDDHLEDAMSQALWLREVAREAWLQGRLPSCALPPTVVKKLWPGGLRKPRDKAELARLADYPANGLFQHPFSSQT